MATSEIDAEGQGAGAYDLAPWGSKQLIGISRLTHLEDGVWG